MGATYFYLSDPALLVTGYWGRTDPAASRVVREARASDPNRFLARAHLIDLSHSEGTISSASDEAEHFRTLASTYAATFGPLPTAIIAVAPHLFGLARIFEITGSIQSPPLPIRVVRSWAEAAKYLEVDLAEAHTELERRRRLPAERH